MVQCPICSKPVKSANINQHIDSECQAFIEEPSPERDQEDDGIPVSSFFTRPAASRDASSSVARRQKKSGWRTRSKKSSGLKISDNRRDGSSAHRAVLAHRFFDQCFELLPRHRNAFRPALGTSGVIARDRTTGNYRGRGRRAVPGARDEQFFHISPESNTCLPSNSVIRDTCAKCAPPFPSGKKRSANPARRSPRRD